MKYFYLPALTATSLKRKSFVNLSVRKRNLHQLTSTTKNESIVIRHLSNAVTSLDMMLSCSRTLDGTRHLRLPMIQ